jgi:hypothetical protein
MFLRHLHFKVFDSDKMTTDFLLCATQCLSYFDEGLSMEMPTSFSLSWLGTF